VHHLQQERTFLQQQFDTLRRESMSPSFQPPQRQAVVAAAAVGAPPPEDMEIDEAPNSKRKRVAAPRTQQTAAAATTTAGFTFGASGSGAAKTSAAVAAAPTGVTPPPAAAVVSPSGAGPFSSERRVNMSGRATPTAAATTAALEVPQNLAKMTVQVRGGRLTSALPKSKPAWYSLHPRAVPG